MLKKSLEGTWVSFIGQREIYIESAVWFSVYSPCFSIYVQWLGRTFEYNGYSSVLNYERFQTSIQTEMADLVNHVDKILWGVEM